MKTYSITFYDDDGDTLDGFMIEAHTLRLAVRIIADQKWPENAVGVEIQER